MAVIKCKMCGGNLNATEGSSVAECEYCGTVQTVPNVDNEKKLTLFSRANRLRMACEFDKAAGVYENIVAEFPTEAEAYWGLVLCKYGIEYVDDPATGKKVPTCHRSSFDSVMDDPDFEQACENADAISRRVYREEAKAIEEIRKGIVEVSGKEAPYDIFICYKEANENGDRTIDSVIAQDVYDALTAKGYRLFFSRITLEDKLGTEYEPYIFAALNSAKIMLVFGTDYEYFNAVWVKNEWSRYLKLMAKDKSKHLIPCFKGVDAYDIPKEFQKFQAQDMSKVGAVQDLLRGIDKLLGSDRTSQTSYVQTDRASGPTANSLLRRGNIFLEDENWESADEYFNKVLDIEPECAEAYLGKFLSSCKLTSLEQFHDISFNLNMSKDFARAERFASPDLLSKLRKLRETVELKQLQLRLVKTIKFRYRALVLAERLNVQRMRQKEEENQREELCLRLKSRRDLIKPAANCVALLGPYIICLSANGSLIWLGNPSNDSRYDNIEAIKAKSASWHNIASLAVCDGQTIELTGIKADGTVVTTGNMETPSGVDRNNTLSITYSWCGSAMKINKNGTANYCEYKPSGYLKNWNKGSEENVMKIVSSKYNTKSIGIQSYSFFAMLRTNGTVSGRTYSLFYGQSGVYEMIRSFSRASLPEDKIVDIAAIDGMTERLEPKLAALKPDGTVELLYSRDAKNYLFDKSSVNFKLEISSWDNIVLFANSTNTNNTYANVITGLKADGTVVTTYSNEKIKAEIESWTDIVAVFQNAYYVIGLKSDGTLVGVAKDKTPVPYLGQIKLFNRIETFSEERAAAVKEYIHERIQLRSSLQKKLNNLKGLFIGMRKKEIEAQIAQIDAELQEIDSIDLSIMKSV